MKYSISINKIIFGLFLVFFGLAVYGQEIDEVQVQEEILCPEIEFSLVGQEEIKAGQLYEFAIDAEDYETYASGTGFSIRHSLQEQLNLEVGGFPGAEIATYDETSFSHEFPGTGEILLSSLVTLGNGCQYQITKNISSYSSILLYVGKDSEVLGLANNRVDTDKFDLLVKKIETENISSDEKLQAYLSTFAAYFRHADRMIIDTSSQGQLFENLGKVLKINGIEKLSTEVYVVADITQSYFRRLLARYMTVAGIEKVFVTQKQHFGSLFTALLVGENPQQFDFLKS